MIDDSKYDVEVGSEISLYLCVALAVATEVKDIPSHPLLTISNLVTGIKVT